MTSQLPLILVIDDLLGRRVSGQRNMERAIACAQFRLRDVTGDAQNQDAAQRIENPVAEVVFCRGQTPVRAETGTVVENDLDQCLRAVEAGWPLPEDGHRRWAMVLLDLCFMTGTIPGGKNGRHAGMPEGSAEDEHPLRCFGLQILEAIHRRYPALPVVMFSTIPREEVSREFARRGARAFLEKAGGSEDLCKLLEMHGLIQDKEKKIVGASLPLLLALRAARRAADGRVNLLIRGERGTGKELLAHYVHRCGNRGRTQPFVVVNSGALGEHLYGSELFGHEKGAFTGANAQRIGRIEEANGGDLFLDEIGNVLAQMQAALLRVLENRVVTRVGSNKGTEIDVRFLSATNKDVEDCDEFRDDLLDRLREGGTLVLPPLRDRREDIPLLVEPFVREAERSRGAMRREITLAALEKLMAYHWPGNIRQLRSCLLQAVIDFGDVEHLEDFHLNLPTTTTSSAQGLTSTRPLADERVGDAASLSERLGDYELLQEIGQGNNGVVYKARQMSLDRIVAVKSIASGRRTTTQDIRRFRIEARTAARLDHPCIVPIYDFDSNNGQHFFVMGYVEGTNLEEKTSKGPLRPRCAAELVRKLAEAVHYAHERGVVHRDLKPANILLDDNGEPRISDFGLAKCLDVQSGLSSTGQIIGTPCYMPPEQAEGRHAEVGPAADVYSLGAVLYYLMTWRPPFAAADIGEVLRQVRKDHPIPPRQFDPSIDRNLQAVCLKCMEKDVPTRYASAKDLARDLQRWLRGEDVEASGEHCIDSYLVHSVLLREFANFNGASSNGRLHRVTSAASAIILGHLDRAIAHIERGEGTFSITALYRLLTGKSEKANTCKSHLARLFLLNPDHASQEIHLSPRLALLAREVANRNSEVRKLLDTTA